MQQLFLNELPADLPVGATVRLNQASNDASQLDVRIGERSYPITLPPTRRNDLLLQHARLQLQANKFNRPTDLTARFLIDGVNVLPPGAVCRLQAAGRDGYDVLLYAPGVALGETLAAKSLRDLTSLPARAYASVSDLEDLIAGDRTTETLAAPFIAYGNFFSADDTKPLNAIDTGVRLDDYVLSVYALNVLEAIFREAGYRIDGTPLLAEEWQTAAIPYTHSEPFPWPWGSLGSGAIITNYDDSPADSYTDDPCGLLSAPKAEYTGSALTGDEYTVATSFLAPQAGDYEVSAQWQRFARSPQTADLYIVVTTPTGEETATLIDSADTGPGPSLPAHVTSSVITTTVSALEAGTRIELVANTGTGLVGWDWVEMEVALTGGATTINPALVLPAMTQKDFVKAFLALTNSTFTLDEERKAVTFHQRDQLPPAAAESALVLDDYVNPASFTYKPAALFKEVSFTYTADSKDAVAATGSGDTTEPMTAAGRTETKEVSVPFAASGRREYLWAADGTTRSFICLADTDQLSQKRSEADWSYDYAPRLLTLMAPSAYYLDVYTDHDTTTPVAYAQAAFGPGSPLDSNPSFAWQGDTGRVAAYYQSTLELLTSSELVTTEILLDPGLYRQLTPGRVVRICGVLYFVNKLEGFQPGTSRPATLELLRYVAPSGR